MTMLTEDGKHLYVSYDEYHNLIEKLAIKIHQSGWQFDTILCLARGGMRPGDILSRSSSCRRSVRVSAKCARRTARRRRKTSRRSRR